MKDADWFVDEDPGEVLIKAPMPNEIHTIARVISNGASFHARLIVRSVNLHDELVAALQAAADDHQCAIRCDGPHPDCICWYCRIGAVLKKAEAP